MLVGGFDTLAIVSACVTLARAAGIFEEACHASCGPRACIVFAWHSFKRKTKRTSSTTTPPSRSLSWCCLVIALHCSRCLFIIVHRYPLHGSGAVCFSTEELINRVRYRTMKGKHWSKIKEGHWRSRRNLEFRHGTAILTPIKHSSKTVVSELAEGKREGLGSLPCVEQLAR